MRLCIRGWTGGAMLAGAACGGSDPASPPATATKLVVSRMPSTVSPNRAPFATQPIIQVTDASGRAVASAGVTVTATVTTAGAVLLGITTATTTTNGAATFTDLAIGGTTGDKSLSFQAAGLTSATASIATTAGAAAAADLVAGDSQTEAEGIAVPIAPAVRITDVDDNAVTSTVVTFAVTGGGGTASGASPTTNAQGIATVGAWILGTAGPNTLAATAPSIATPTTFHATAVRLPVAVVTMTALGGPLRPQETQQFTATPKDSIGRPLSGRAVTWTSGDAAVATVSQSGLVTGILPGTTTITAASEGKSAHAPLVVVAPPLTLEFGLTGHLGSELDHNQIPAPPFQYGFGFYSSIHALNQVQAGGTQLGWGTWLMPENQTFGQALCPVGTYARDNWPDRGPTYRDVYQTIEGGAGEWGSTHFPSPVTKFRINATSDCYSHEIASPGWQFGGELLPANKLGLAQLSNRLLIPPDGIVFAPGNGQSFIGHGWIALPLIPAMTSSLGVPTGDQSWTLFFHGANFRGPVAFYTPETWSALNATDPTGIGRGHDARPMFAGGLAMEMGQAPFFTATDASGQRYRRIPRLLFPATGQTTVMIRDPRFYSKQAFWDKAAAWLENGTVATSFDAAGVYAPAVSGGGIGLTMGGAQVSSTASFTVGPVAAPGGGQAFGYTWAGGLEPGVFPEYYKEVGGNWVPVPASEVPRTTWLADQVFPAQPISALPALERNSNDSPWTPDHWSAGPFSATLSDGSTVDYVWYRFVDQPAITRLGLPAAYLAKLQAFVTSLHQQSGVAGPSIPGPSGGTLATFDQAQLVTPPPGLEFGYVPIVMRQRK